MRDLVGELRARGTTVFLNSHLLGEVEATCDRVAFVKQGRIVHELALAASTGSLELEVHASPLDPATRDGLARFGTVLPAARTDTVCVRVTTDEVVPEIARWLVARGENVHALRPRRKSLEEWFVEVMGADQRPG